MDFIFQLGLIILLVFLNGYFVASEYALVSVRKTRIAILAKKGRRRAKMVHLAVNNLDSFISATQLGITLASLALGWIGEPALARYIEPGFNFLPHNLKGFSAHSIATLIAFSLITFLHIVLGEQAPKMIALKRAEGTSLLIIAPLMLFTKIFSPFIFILNKAGSLVIKILGLKPPREQQLVHSEDEIRMILNQSAKSGIIPLNEAKMVNNVFHLADMQVKKIMIPKKKIIAFKSSTFLSSVIRTDEKNIHSRYPVYDRNINEITGFIHIRDIYENMIKTEKNLKISETGRVRKIIRAEETKRIDEILLEMRKKRIHMAVITDHNGKTRGIATLEDILESLVGEIHDEFEKN